MSLRFSLPLAPRCQNERCQKLGWERCIVNVRQTGPFFSPTVILKRHTKKAKNSPIEECALSPHPALKCPTAIEARHMGAVYALFRFCSGQPLSMVLPPYFRPYWTELTKEKAVAEEHRAWEWAEDPFNARKQVSERQEKKKTNDTNRAAAVAADPLGGGKGVVTSGQMERLPEVKMTPSLRELVEETIKDQMLAFPDAILQATKESTESAPASRRSSPDLSSVSIDPAALNASLTSLGFRPAHVKSVISFLLKAKQRVEQGGDKPGEPLDPLVLSLSTLSPEEAAIEWLILHLPEVRPSPPTRRGPEQAARTDALSPPLVSRTTSPSASVPPARSPTSSARAGRRRRSRRSSRRGSSTSSSRSSASRARPSRTF